eukprot:TRINITY_DN15641_c0_g1_i1.p1 TRINITY_DN15641_c0_g1~~TRINITY_DN15641_c0_g1_i1.p1  ORF type:complete len:200 (-),score=21.83 TRINITY_DN15641_c0_g1_i1:21-620(-)
MYSYTPGTCGACREPIIGDHIVAFQMQWHLDHLLCTTCSKDFSDGSQVCEGIDGYAYCVQHWQERFCPPCGTCGKPIIGPTTNALNRTYHSETCFVCIVCKAKLEGKYYPSKKGELLCEFHYYQDSGLICGFCSKPIIAGQTITMKPYNDPTDKKDYGEMRFHKDHFKCTRCQGSLAGQKYKRMKGKQYCITCHLELFE